MARESEQVAPGIWVTQEPTEETAFCLLQTICLSRFPHANLSATLFIL